MADISGLAWLQCGLPFLFDMISAKKAAAFPPSHLQWNIGMLEKMRNQVSNIAPWMGQISWLEKDRFELKRSKLPKFWIQWTFNMVTFLNQRSQDVELCGTFAASQIHELPLFFWGDRAASSLSFLGSWERERVPTHCCFLLWWWSPWKTVLSKQHLNAIWIPGPLFFFVKLTSQRGPNNLDLSGIVYFPQHPRKIPIP